MKEEPKREKRGKPSLKILYKTYKTKLIAAFLLFVFFIISILFSLYSSAKKTIITYNSLLTQAYATLDPEVLRLVSSQNEVRKLSIVIQNYRFYKKHPIMELQELKYKGFGWNWNGVKVVTQEKWFFQTVNQATGKAGAVYVYNYEVLYNLKRVGLSFLVDEVKVLKERKKRI